MSKFIPTSDGLYRAVVDEGGNKSFLFECPVCGEWLPFGEDVLAGQSRPLHFLRGTKRLCEWSHKKEFGSNLVATLQARALIAAEGSGLSRPYETNEHEARRQMKEFYGIDTATL